MALWVFLAAIQVGLQDHGRGDGVQVAAALFAGNAEGQAGGSGGLCAAGFVPQFDRDGGLRLDSARQAGGAAHRRGAFTLRAGRLSDDDLAGAAFGSDLGNAPGAFGAGAVTQHGERVGNRSGRVAEGQAEAFFSRVHGEDAHGSDYNRTYET